MISPISVTRNYILQPELLEKHTRTVNWLSASLLWKGELTFFQKTLDEHAAFFTSPDDKKQVAYFQELLLYYKDVAVVELRSRLRNHEARLASMLETKNEANVQYYKEHDNIMQKLEMFSILFKRFRNDFLLFMEKAVAGK